VSLTPVPLAKTRAVQKSDEYLILDAGDFEKLEQVGPYRLVRPAASAVWSKTVAPSEWTAAQIRFERASSGDGEWKTKGNSPDFWDISVDELRFRLRLTSFGHLGIFPEQNQNWRQLSELVAKHKSHLGECRVLNLFAYTGGSTLACAKAGAVVTHVDASKTSVSWAKENASLNDISDDRLRWIVDDVGDFVRREVRRGNTYHGIILDPPSYGRGPKKQLWKIEKDLMPLLGELKKITDPKFVFALLSSHSPGYSALGHENQLRQIFGPNLSYESSELTLPTKNGPRVPSGNYALAFRS
jgi:23S rRNA (cytosine1962-C5)-methyltransferase